MIKEPLTFKVPGNMAFQRADIVFMRLFNASRPEREILSRGQVSRLMKQKRIVREGFPVKPDTLVKAGDILTLPKSVETTFRGEDIPEIYLEAKEFPEAMEPKILYENHDFVVVNKPAGLVTHPTGKPSFSPTLVQWFFRKYPEARTVGEARLRPGVVHRLDRETSGAIILAKTQASFQDLKSLFQRRAIEKRYLALVYGHLPSLEGEIDFPLIRRGHTLKRRAVLRGSPAEKNTRSAQTWYRVMRRYRAYDYVEVTPRTGRTHQIRVHMAALRHPVVGDKWYAFKPERRATGAFPLRHLLHAASLSFVWKGTKLRITAPLPNDFRDYLHGIDETVESRYDDEALKRLL